MVTRSFFTANETGLLPQLSLPFLLAHLLELFRFLGRGCRAALLPLLLGIATVALLVGRKLLPPLPQLFLFLPFLQCGRNASTCEPLCVASLPFVDAAPSPLRSSIRRWSAKCANGAVWVPLVCWASLAPFVAATPQPVHPPRRPRSLAGRPRAHCQQQQAPLESAVFAAVCPRLVSTLPARLVRSC